MVVFRIVVMILPSVLVLRSSPDADLVGDSNIDAFLTTGGNLRSLVEFTAVLLHTLRCVRCTDEDDDDIQSLALGTEVSGVSSELACLSTGCKVCLEARMLIDCGMTQPEVVETVRKECGLLYRNNR